MTFIPQNLEIMNFHNGFHFNPDARIDYENMTEIETKIEKPKLFSKLSKKSQKLNEQRRDKNIKNWFQILDIHNVCKTQN